MISSKGPLGSGVRPSEPVGSSLWQLEELHVPAISPHNLSPNDDSSLAAVSVLNAERDRLVAEAYDAGFDAGRDAAMTNDSSRLTNAVEVLRTAAEQIIGSEERTLSALEENLAAL